MCDQNEVQTQSRGERSIREAAKAWLTMYLLYCFHPSLTPGYRLKGYLLVGSLLAVFSSLTCQREKTRLLR